MHSAIFVVQVPDQGIDAGRQQWLNYLGAVEASDLPAADRLAENVWLVNFEKHPEVLARLIDAAVRQYKLPYRILRLYAAPQWLPVETDPSTTVVQSEG